MNSRNGVSLRPLVQVLVAACLVLVAALFVAACSSMNGTVTTGMAQVKVTLSDPATCMAPNGPFSAVYVTVSDVQANVSSSAGANDSGWVDLTPGLSASPKQVELLGLSTNQCLLVTLGDNMELQAGNYQQIRLILATSSANVSGDMCGGGGNCVVVGSGDQAKTYPLQLSSEAQTGIKIPPGQIAGGQISIPAGQTRDLNIDFNTCLSIVKEGNGQYRLKPVLTAGVVSQTSVSMNGKVVDANGSAVANAIVALEQPDPAGIAIPGLRLGLEPAQGETGILHAGGIRRFGGQGHVDRDHEQPARRERAIHRLFGRAILRIPRPAVEIEHRRKGTWSFRLINASHQHPARRSPPGPQRPADRCLFHATPVLTEH